MPRKKRICFSFADEYKKIKEQEAINAQTNE